MHPPEPVAAAPVDPAQRLEIIAPGYLARVRRASQRLAHRNDAVIDTVTALADMEDASELDIDAPTLSRSRIGRLVKVLVRRLIGWYLRYLTQQITAFAAAVNRFGATMVDRTDRIEEATTAVASDLDRLRRRVEHLEQLEQGGRPPEGMDGAGPGPSDGSEAG